MRVSPREALLSLEFSAKPMLIINVHEGGINMKIYSTDSRNGKVRSLGSVNKIDSSMKEVLLTTSNGYEVCLSFDQRDGGDANLLKMLLQNLPKVEKSKFT